MRTFDISTNGFVLTAIRSDGEVLTYTYQQTTYTNNAYQQQSTYSRFSLAGLPTNQHTDIHASSGPNLEQEVETAYVWREGALISAVTGHAYWADGSGDHTISKLYATYNANGDPASIEGALTDEEGFRAFIPDAEGRIVLKTDGKDKHGYYFYIDGSPYLAYGDFPLSGLTVGNPPKYLNADLDYHPLPLLVGNGNVHYQVQPSDTWSTLAQRLQVIH